MERGRNGFLQEQAWVYLQGAEHLAAMALRLDAQQDAVTDRHARRLERAMGPGGDTLSAG